jgi:hypothetical protein
MRTLLVVICLATALPVFGESVAEAMRNGKPPLEYVLSKIDAHPIVIIGEGHWIRGDVELIRARSACVEPQ